MSTSQHTMDQVRSILGRLDRSIDQAREKRLHGSAPSGGSQAEKPQSRAEEAAQRKPVAPPPAVGPARPVPSRAPSPFGRAKPLRNANEGSTGRWSDRGTGGQSHS